MFAFSGFNIVWLLHPLTNVSIFLPWLFWFTYKLTTPDLAPDQRLEKLHLGLSLVVFLQFLGGHVETSFHICFATACYVMYRLASSHEGHQGHPAQALHLDENPRQLQHPRDRGDPPGFDSTGTVCALLARLLRTLHKGRGQQECVRCSGRSGPGLGCPQHLRKPER